MRPDPRPKPASLRSILQLARAPAVFTALSNILAAQLIASPAGLAWSELFLLGGASALIYSAGMVLNDCFDVDADARERPDRPLPSGRVPLHAAWAGGWFLLVAGVLLASAVGRRSLIVAAALALAVVLYDGALKNGPAGSLSMGACRYLNWLLGFSFLPWTAWPLLVPIPVFVYVASLTQLAKEETRADRRAPLAACIAGMIFSASFIAALLVTGKLINPWAAAPLALGLGWVLLVLVEAWRTFSPASVQSAVTLLLFGIIPLDALLVFAGGPRWGALAVLALLFPGRMIGRTIDIT